MLSLLTRPSVYSSQIRACSSAFVCSMSSPTIRVAELKDLLKNSPNTTKVLDATYSAAPCEGPTQFKEKGYHGKVDVLAKLWENAEYKSEHLPNAVHFHNDVATFPCQYKKQNLYDKDVFQKYVRMLGVNQGDNVVVYSRGMGAGMLFAARAWYLLKVYGMENVRVLEGGLEKWKCSGGAVTDQIVSPKEGNWIAKEPCKKLVATFEELFEQGNCDGVQRNLLDARPPGQFNGSECLAFPANGAPGFHLQGAKNVPLPSLLADGELKSADDIQSVLKSAGVDLDKASIAYCNAGNQACLLALALAKAGKPFIVFNGSLVEVSRRKPELISAK